MRELTVRHSWAPALADTNANAKAMRAAGPAYRVSLAIIMHPSYIVSAEGRSSITEGKWTGSNKKAGESQLFRGLEAFDRSLRGRWLPFARFRRRGLGASVR